MSLRSQILCQIVTFGSVNIDIVVRSEKLAAPGETIHADRADVGLGGKGGNQAAAVAKLGHRSVLAGQTGEDAFAVMARQKLETFGVDCTLLTSDPQVGTGLALIAVDARGENSITVIGGSNMTLSVDQLPKFEAALTSADALLLQLEIPIDVVEAAARLVHARGAIVVVDPAPVPHDGLPQALYELATVMTPNETETEKLVGIRPHDQDSAAEAAQIFHARGLKNIIIKLGARGVFWSTGSENGFVPPFRVTAIDSVAAGDSFNGGLATALAEGLSLGDAVRFAAACGALATTRNGAAEAAPTREEVDALLTAQP